MADIEGSTRLFHELGEDYPALLEVVDRVLGVGDSQQRVAARVLSGRSAGRAPPEPLVQGGGRNSGDHAGGRAGQALP